MDNSPSLRRLASIMARHGSLTFGGGGPTTAALQAETVDRHGWLDLTRFRIAYALSRFTPGTNMLAFSTALGWQMRGAPGAIVALIASSLPCSVVAVVFTVLFGVWQRNRWASIAIDGATAAAIGIIAASCWHLIQPHVRPGCRFRTVVFVVGALALQAWDVPPVRILLLAGALGAVWREDA